MLNATPFPHDAADTNEATARHAPASGGSAAPATDTPRPRWSTQALMAGGREAEIAHGGSVYHLRITSLGRLILTK